MEKRVNRRFTIFIVISLVSILLTVSKPVLADDTPTPYIPPSITALPSNFNPINITGTVNTHCYGTPVGWLTVTPNPYWEMLCKGCIPTDTSIPTYNFPTPYYLDTGTVGPTPTSTGTPTPVYTSTPYGGDCLNNGSLQYTGVSYSSGQSAVNCDKPVNSYMGALHCQGTIASSGGNANLNQTVNWRWYSSSESPIYMSFIWRVDSGCTDSPSSGGLQLSGDAVYISGVSLAGGNSQGTALYRTNNTTGSQAFTIHCNHHTGSSSLAYWDVTMEPKTLECSGITPTPRATPAGFAFCQAVQGNDVGRMMPDLVLFTGYRECYSTPEISFKGAFESVITFFLWVFAPALDSFINDGVLERQTLCVQEAEMANVSVFGVGIPLSVFAAMFFMLLIVNHLMHK